MVWRVLVITDAGWVDTTNSIGGKEYLLSVPPDPQFEITMYLGCLVIRYLLSQSTCSIKQYSYSISKTLYRVVICM